MADLKEEFAGFSKLENVGVFLGVASHPDVVLIVDEDAVLIVGPFVPGTEELTYQTFFWNGFDGRSVAR